MTPTNSKGVAGEMVTWFSMGIVDWSCVGLLESVVNVRSSLLFPRVDEESDTSLGAEEVDEGF